MDGFLRQPKDGSHGAVFIEDLVQRLTAMESACELQSETCRQFAQQLMQITNCCREQAANRNMLQTMSAESLHSAGASARPLLSECSSHPLLAPESQTHNEKVVSNAAEKKHQVQSWLDSVFGKKTHDTIEQMRISMTEESYTVTKYYKTRGIFQKIARSHVFDNLSLTVIILSLLWISVDVDYHHSSKPGEAQPIFQVVAYAFLLFFTGELLVRFLAFKHKSNWLLDFWSGFDSAVVLLMFLELFVTVSDGGSLRILRAFRLFRLVRLVRVLKFVPELMVMLKGIGIALRAILVVCGLLTVIVYIGGVGFRILLDGTNLGKERFSSVSVSMGTLLLECTLSGAKGVPIIRDAYHEGFGYALLLLLFVLLSGITVMGILTGVLVQTVKSVAELEKEQQTIRSLTEHMEELWRCLSVRDATGQEYISHKELQQLSWNEDMSQILKQMDVDLDSLRSVEFFLLEESGSRMSLPQFKRMLLDLRGKNQAKVKDHVETRKFLTEQIRQASLLPQRRGLTGSIGVPLTGIAVPPAAMAARSVGPLPSEDTHSSTASESESASDR